MSGVSSAECRAVTTASASRRWARMAASIATWRAAGERDDENPDEEPRADSAGGPTPKGRSKSSRSHRSRARFARRPDISSNCPVLTSSPADRWGYFPGGVINHR